MSMRGVYAGSPLNNTKDDSPPIKFGRNFHDQQPFRTLVEFKGTLLGM